MEVHFSPDKEARLRRFAIRHGKDVGRVVEEAVDRMLESAACSTEAEEGGRAAGRRVEEPLVRAGRSARRSVTTYAIAAITAVLLIGLPSFFVASRYLASPDLWVDESDQVWLSLGLHHFTPPLTPPGGWGDIVRFGRAMDSDPGAFTVLLRFWMMVFGFSPLAVRSLPFVFFLLTPVVVILSARRCGASPIFAALAGSIPLGFPMILHYATEVRPYSMEACAVALLFFLPCWLTDERRDRTVILIGGLAGRITVLCLYLRRRSMSHRTAPTPPFPRRSPAISAIWRAGCHRSGSSLSALCPLPVWRLASSACLCRAFPVAWQERGGAAFPAP